jgi:hypothetical protein
MTWIFRALQVFLLQPFFLQLLFHRPQLTTAFQKSQLNQTHPKNPSTVDKYITTAEARARGGSMDVLAVRGAPLLPPPSGKKIYINLNLMNFSGQEQPLKTLFIESHVNGSD